VLLASSDEYPNQAFCVGTAYGIQFHVEVTSSMAQEWASVPAYAAALDAVRGPGSLLGLLAEFEDARVSMQRVAEAIGHRFGDLVEASATSRLSTFKVADSVGGV
jgi:GMP synthase (glutamine-hydrolysing)